MADPQPVRRQGFQYDGAFTVDGIAPENPDVLRRLCFPSDPPKARGRGRPRKIQPISEEDSKRTLTAKFVQAQSRFYGVAGLAKSPGENLVPNFKQHVEAGDFQNMADDIVRLQAEMATEWKSLNGIKEPVSRGRGRPKGSTNKPAAETPAEVVSLAQGRPRRQISETPAASAPETRGRPIRSEAQISSDSTAPPSRGRGRPKGSTKKAIEEAVKPPSRGPGRPKGSTKKAVEEAPTTPSRGRGRPKGSNKKAVGEAPTTPSRGRGRPKGSTKKAIEEAAKPPSRGPGRPKGSTKKVVEEAPTTPSRGRGRPKGTKATAGGPSKATAKGKGSTPMNQTSSSIVGSYAIKCDEIEEGWSDMSGLALDIMEGPVPGIYLASFDFGVLEGVMVLSADEDQLDHYIKALEGEDSSGSDSDSDPNDDESESDTRAGTKRKASANPRGKASKKAKTAPAKAAAPTQFFLQWVGRETGEGEIQTGVHTGTIDFANRKYARFSGEMDLVFVGGGGEFEGTKVSDVPRAFSKSWGDFSEASYEYDRVNRWG